MTLTTSTLTSLSTPIVAAYFPEWGIYGRDYPIAAVPADRLTHLIYAFAQIDSSGRMALFDGYAATEKRFTDSADAVGGEADSWSYPADDPRSSQEVWGNFNQISELKALHPHLRTSIAIGGWTLSGNFSSTFDTAGEREVFAQSVVDFLRSYTMFDGVDFDWEYPGGGGLDGNANSAADGAHYVATLQLVREKLDALGAEMGRRYEISVASAAGPEKIANFNLSELKDFVDFFNVMTYDFHGTWESETGHQSALQGDSIGYDISTAVDLYLQAGVDPARIVLGSPAYTRAWKGVQSSPDEYGVEDFGYGDSTAGAAPGTFEAGVYDYKDLLGQYRAGGWKLIWDDKAQAAYLWNPEQQIFSSFETPATVALKSAWAREKGLGGMMFWDLSNDASGDSESLIDAAADFWLDGRSFAEIVSTSGLRFDAIVGGNGQFDLADVLTDPASAGPGVPVDLLPQPLTPQPLTPQPVVPSPEIPPVTPMTSGGIAVALQLSSQWSGAFEGQVVLTNQGSQPLDQWSVSFTSRYELRGLSDFTLQQTRLGDGRWQVTLSPPSWGTSLPSGVATRSYVQGLIPGGAQLASLDSALVLVGTDSSLIPDPAPTPSPIAPPTPAPVDPITGTGTGTGTDIGIGTGIGTGTGSGIGGGLAPAPVVDVLVGSGDTRLLARSDQAEQFQLSYAWGRQLTIEGFDPSQDRLDLRSFWGEGQQARVLGSAEGVRIELPFNQQAVLLSGVNLDQWLPQTLQVWAG